MAQCDVCLTVGGNQLTSNVVLCDDCRYNTSRGRDIDTLLPLYRVVETSSTTESLAQLAFHNLFNTAVRGAEDIQLDEAGMPEGDLQFAVGLYWAFGKSDATKTRYPDLIIKSKEASLSVGDDSEMSFPESMHAGEEAEAFTQDRWETQQSIGGIASPDQHQKVALRRYGDYGDTLKKKNGFDIHDAVDCVEQLYDEIHSRLRVVEYRTLGEAEWERFRKAANETRGSKSAAVRGVVADIIESNTKELEDLWFDRSEILACVDNPHAEAFVEAMSCSIGNAEGYAVNNEAEQGNTRFRCPYDVRPTELYLFIEDDDRLLWPFPQLAHKVLAEKFHYQLMNSDVSDEYRDSQGDYVEEIVHEGLAEVFSGMDGTVLRSVYYDDPRRDESATDPETDIIVKWKNYLLVIECKSRAMVADTRAGKPSGAAIRDEIEHDSGIGGGYDQAMRLTNGIRRSKVRELRAEDGTTVSVSGDLLVLPMVVLGAHYEYIASGGFVPILDFEKRPPYVADIYSLDSILQLTSPNEFFAYVMRRMKLLDSDLVFLNSDELDFFAAFRSGLLDSKFLEALIEYDYSEHVREALEHHDMESDGTMLQFEVGDFLQEVGLEQLGIQDQMKDAMLGIGAKDTGVAQTVTLPLNHRVRTQAYPLSQRQ